VNPTEIAGLRPCARAIGRQPASASVCREEIGRIAEGERANRSRSSAATASSHAPSTAGPRWRRPPRDRIRRSFHIPQIPDATVLLIRPRDPWRTDLSQSSFRFHYRTGGLELTVRRWTTDRLIVNEVLRKIAYPEPRCRQTILDLGAHIGTFSVLAARAGARVLAFEPDASNFALLRTNVSAYPTVEPVPLAVAATSGRRTLRRQSRCTTSG